ncbi:MAG: hypothetical protein JWN93_3211, partial [Hyphomicrobiales bacterium]|nr:hypothetical protein [Hyphomicrobiales bacterium]
PIPPMAPTAAPPPPASLPSAPLPSAPPPSGPLPPGPPADPQGELTPDTRRGMSFEWLENAIKRDPDAPTGRVASEPAASDAPAEDASRLSRRFESHGVKYNLFNDGRIEAEADGQLHRFSSLTELRAFLDKRMKDQQGP